MKILFVLTSLFCFGSETITAIMITGKTPFHLPFARLSIASFLEQTYPHKCLLIVNDGETLLGPFESHSIVEIKLDRKYNLGQLRNIGLDCIAENALWIQWDDDDWHHPQIIEEQYEFLISQNADLCCLKKQVQYAFAINGAWETRHTLFGTAMGRKKRDLKYPEIALSEDAIYFDAYAKKYRIAQWNNPPHYYLRLIHGHNSWDDRHFHLEKKRRDEWCISEESKNYLRSILPLYSGLCQ